MEGRCWVDQQRQARTIQEDGWCEVTA